MCMCIRTCVCLCVHFVCHLFLTRGAQKSSSQDARRPPSAPAGAQGLRAKTEGTEYMYGLYTRSLYLCMYLFIHRPTASYRPLAS